MRFLRNHFISLTRAIVWMSAFFGVAWAQTTLTTIQDTLFRADGTRFTGSLQISWNTFDASGLGTVAQQSKTVSVVNGNLYVQLAPNATAQPPANIYTVLYQSDGYQQFTETWTVPVSATPLKVSQVRLSIITANAATGTTASNDAPITEAAVIGLVTDLMQRPLKGPAFGGGAVAIIDQNGQIEAAVGTPGSCVMVDGTTGPCGSPVPGFVDAEIPGGIVDGTNNTFTLQNSPAGGSLMLFRNGMYMLAGFDYTLTGSTIQFVGGAVPQPKDTLVASYRVPPTGGAAASSGSGSGAAGSQSSGLAQVICSATGSSTGFNAWTSLGGCDVPAADMQPGDRIDIRFTFAHTGSNSGFNVEVDWGSTAIVSRSGSAQDAAFAGSADAAIGSAGAQISTQSWGTVLAFSPGIQSAAAQTGVHIGLKSLVSTPGADSVTLTNYTVLRYPAN